MLIRTRWFDLSRRGAALLLFGVVFVLLGYSYLTLDPATAPMVNRALHAALRVAPIHVYGWAWIACGVLAIIGGLVHRVDWLGFGAATIMPSIWALAYFVAWIGDGIPRAWVSASVYTLIALDIVVIAGMADPLDTQPRPRGRDWWFR